MAAVLRVPSVPLDEFGLVGYAVPLTAVRYALVLGLIPGGFLATYKDPGGDTIYVTDQSTDQNAP